jgi:hypothetical protein
LFTDINLPEGDLAGLELAQEARKMNPKLKVVYTSAYNLTDGMNRCSSRAHRKPSIGPLRSLIGPGLDRLQVENNGLNVLRAEDKDWHVRVSRHDSFGKSFLQTIDWISA